jgi:hypothetical protein
MGLGTFMNFAALAVAVAALAVSVVFARRQSARPAIHENLGLRSFAAPRPVPSGALPEDTR